MAKSKARLGEDIPYFYVPDIAESCELTLEEAKHAYRVLRLSSGDRINISDGRGHLYSAYLSGGSPKEPTVSDLMLIGETDGVSPKMELAIAPTKNIDRIEWVLEKLTEVGMSRLSLVITERTVRQNINMDRLDRLMVAAMKQSEKLWRVELNLYGSLAQYLSEVSYEGRYIGYCAEVGEKWELKELFVKGRDSSFLIGPEGDFTSEEVRIAMDYGFLPVSLGRERLRTETAGLYVGMLHHLFND